MSHWDFYNQPTELIPFSLGDFPGTVAVYYGANQEPARVGYDYLAGPSFDPDRCRGYPVIHARIESYAGTGIRTMLSWIQIVTSLYSDSHDPQASKTESFIEVDVAPSLEDAGFPFYSFGSNPQLFDAPCRNLGDQARLCWTADSFLTTLPIRSREEPIAWLRGFRWGYIETNLPDEKPILLPLEVTGAEVWNQQLSFLTQTYPDWNFQP